MLLLYIFIFFLGIISGRVLDFYISRIFLEKSLLEKRFLQGFTLRIINGGLYLLIFTVNGLNFISGLYCLMSSALFVISIIDFRTFEIPYDMNKFIMALGIVRLAVDYRNWPEYVLGLLGVSVVLLIVLVVSGGRAIGGGDVKLMASCGLILGRRLIWIAFFVGCIIGLIIHLIRLKISDTGKVLAMGPYLSTGVLFAALWGDLF